MSGRGIYRLGSSECFRTWCRWHVCEPAGWARARWACLLSLDKAKLSAPRSPNAHRYYGHPSRAHARYELRLHPSETPERFGVWTRGSVHTEAPLQRAAGYSRTSTLARCAQRRGDPASRPQRLGTSVGLGFPSVATPQAARGWARPPCRRFKTQLLVPWVCFFEVAGFQGTSGCWLMLGTALWLVLLGTTLPASLSAAPKTLRRAHFDDCSACGECAPGAQTGTVRPPPKQVLLPKCDVCTGCTASLRCSPFQPRKSES